MQRDWLNAVGPNEEWSLGNLVQSIRVKIFNQNPVPSPTNPEPQQPTKPDSAENKENNNGHDKPQQQNSANTFISNADVEVQDNKENTPSSIVNELANTNNNTTAAVQTTQQVDQDFFFLQPTPVQSAADNFQSNLTKRKPENPSDNPENNS